MDRFLFQSSFCGVRCRRPLLLHCLGLLGACSLAMGVCAREAVACSVALPPPELVGSPANGDVGVPTDVVPYYSRSAALLSENFNVPLSLVSASGDVVPVTVESNYWDYLELLPEGALEPNTEYTLSVTLNTAYDGTGESIINRVTFATGGGPFEGTVEPPDASLVHYQFAAPPRSSCSPLQSGTCVAFQQQFPIVAASIDEFGQEQFPAIRDRPYFINLSGINQGTNFNCERLRSRAPNGTLSEPVDLCGEDGPLYKLGEDENIECTSNGLTQGGVVVMEDTGTEPLDAGVGADAGPVQAADAGVSADADADPDSGGARCSLGPSGQQLRPMGLLAAGLLPIAWAARARRRGRPVRR
jgi:hypothetical protein